MPIALSGIVNGMAPFAITGYYAKLAAGIVSEEERPSPTGGSTLVLRQPVGVIAAITPWNYPQALAIMKIAPHPAAGGPSLSRPRPRRAWAPSALPTPRRAARSRAGWSLAQNSVEWGTDVACRGRLGGSAV